MTDLVDLTGRPIPKVGAAPELAFEDRAKQLPEPSGYRILCAIPEIEKTTEGGITSNLLTVKVQDWALLLSSMAMMVMVIGPACEAVVPGAGI